MKSPLLIVSITIISVGAFAQNSIAPGGVKGVAHWYVTDSFAHVPAFKSRVANHASIPIVSTSHSISRFNFHPTLVFTGKDHVSIPLGNQFDGASYFTVYHSTDTAEEQVWHINKNDTTELVLTTSRMADLSTYRYMNYTDMVRLNPKVNTVVQQSNAGTAVKQVWNIGERPLTPQLPVTSFKGLIPEVVAYNRVLNTQERLRVASYLALKYGITLTEPNATYLNSSGKKIWDGINYKPYHHNIAGIARDDSSGLEQKISTSSNNPGLLTIATKDTLSDNTFLLWGDNGMPLIPGEKITGVPGLLQKKWLMISSGNIRPFTTDVMLDTRQVDAPLPVKPVYWLAIDRSGTGDFSLPGTEFIKMALLDPQGKAHFKEVVWDKNGLGKEVWGCIVAQDLLLSASIINPSCTDPGKGSLQVKVWGGKPPYQFVIENNRHQITNQEITTAGTPLSFSNLAAGRYLLSVTDASQQVYRDSFYVNNSDGPGPASVAKKYLLLPGTRLHINAADGMPNGLFYQWTGPNNFQTFSPQVSLTQAGVYTLSCTKDGCTNTQELVVTTSTDNFFDNNINVYPNPSRGLFTVKIALEKPANVNMSIYDVDGRLIAKKQLEGFANYTFANKLAIDGAYVLVFRSGLSTATKKVIIIK